MLFELEPVFNNVGFSLDISHEIDLSGAELNGGFPFQKPVKVTGAVVNSAGVVSVMAEAAFTLFLSCDRCAAPIERQISVPVEHVLVTELNDDANAELILLESLRFDLSGLVTDDIFLTLPMRFLCKDGCKGICAQCGQNLNQDPCSCKKPVDPRLQALEQLLDK
ncbi:MAG: DUF177 domain-containing protein [Oscillospiraceae bacterium]|nr:DUF177 domain-containing protein [Oscillospiraceae bacterium]